MSKRCRRKPRLKSGAERIIDAIEKLEIAGILDLEIEVYTNGEYKTADELADSLEDELSYAAEASE